MIITSALCLAQAISNTGAINTLMAALTPGLTQIPALGLLIGVYLMTLMMTELMTNNAAAALMFPLAWGVGMAAGLDPFTADATRVYVTFNFGCQHSTDMGESWSSITSLRRWLHRENPSWSG